MRITTFTVFFTTTIRVSLARHIVSLILVLLTTVAMPQEQSAASESQLQALRAATSLRREGLKPWHLKLSFILNGMDGKPQDSGVAEVNWQGKSHETVSVQSGLIHGAPVDALSSKDAKAAREAFLIDKLLDDTLSPVPPFTAADTTVHAVRRNFGKVQVTCLNIGGRGIGPELVSMFSSYCFEPEHPDILRAKTDAMAQTLLNRPASFQGLYITTDNAIFYAGLLAIEGKVEGLATVPAEASDAQDVTISAVSSRPDGAVVAGSKISGDEPSFPEVARAAHVSGSVLLNAVIDKSGHINRLIPIASRSELLVGSAVQGVKTWVYKPFLLNGQPVEVHTMITINFNLNAAN